MPYNYPIAEKIHSSIPALNSRRMAMPKPGLLDGKISFEEMQEVYRQEATAFLDNCLREDLGYNNDNALKTFQKKYSQTNWQTALTVFAQGMNDLAVDTVTGFTNAVENHVLQYLQKLGPAMNQIPLEKLITLQMFVPLHRQGLEGAFQNAIATVCGLIDVVARKLPHPTAKAPEEDWRQYTERFKSIMMKNIYLLRNFARLHFDTQVVFHNLQNIRSRAEHLVYPFNREHFILAAPKSEAEHLTLSETFIQEIIKECNKPNKEIYDNDNVRPINFSDPARGCPVLELETEKGNFFNGYCKWLHLMFEKFMLPNIKHYVLGLDQADTL